MIDIISSKKKLFQTKWVCTCKVASTTEKVNSIGGLIFAGEIFKWFKLDEIFNFRENGRRSGRITDAAICHTMMALLF